MKKEKRKRKRKPKDTRTKHSTGKLRYINTGEGEGLTGRYSRHLSGVSEGVERLGCLLEPVNYRLQVC